MTSSFTICLRLLTVSSALLLAACAGTLPTRYHSLLDAPADKKVATGSPAPFLIDLRPVGIPAQVDRPQLVVRDGGGVLPLEQERWIAPLADEARAALSADLSRELATTDVAGQPRPAGVRVLNIKIDLRRFDSVPGAYAAVDAVWSLAVDAAAASPLVCASAARASAGAGYDELVRAQRRALADIASRIASALRTYAAAGKGACPAG
ncbi:MAG: membrane integrity-associated transporter subunit PqiC [Proteobacteria bacterium]|uniref:membrane integrity-associated transporter subunit PqiC n=1 Tax=Rudaea sp. TaxID=2136325 RepID=UPI003784D25C|nr:membrane integrity-associated transporter subunit PqiC [Pseudomonadota bacterium]